MHMPAQNCWQQVQSKLQRCSKTLLSWTAKKRRDTSREIEEKVTNLKHLQTHECPKQI